MKDTVTFVSTQVDMFYSLIPKSRRQIPVYLAISLYWFLYMVEPSYLQIKKILCANIYMWYLVLFTTFMN